MLHKINKAEAQALAFHLKYAKSEADHQRSRSKKLICKIIIPNNSLLFSFRKDPTERPNIVKPIYFNGWRTYLSGGDTSFPAKRAN